MFAATFGNGGAYLGSATLLTALEGYPDLKGKRSSINGAKEILIRAAVAAVLNETAFGALYPAADATTLKADVVAALNSNNRETILELAATLDAWNNNYLLDSNGDVVIDPNTGLPVTTGTCPLPRPIV